MLSCHHATINELANDDEINKFISIINIYSISGKKTTIHLPTDFCKHSYIFANLKGN
jgi:hypothetical protein